MRFLYDTNVLAGLARKEELARFRSILLTGNNIHVTSKYILSELEAVLTSKLGFTRQKAKITCSALAKLSIVAASTEIEKISRDPLDDYILAAALTGKAEYLVTADKDLLILVEYKEVKIVSPKEFYRLISKT